MWRKGVVGVQLFFPPADVGRMARGGVGQAQPALLFIHLPGVWGLSAAELQPLPGV